jgi:hypothetical protein
VLRCVRTSRHRGAAGGAQGAQARADGLRLYTADFDSVSLCGFYRGRSAFLMLSGPSLTQIDLSQLNKRGIVTMAVNNAWSVHRPTLWTCVDDPGRFIDTGWKDPGILKFVPTCMWDKRLRIQNPDGTMRNSAFKVRQMPSVLFFRRSDHFDHERFLTGDTSRGATTPSTPTRWASPASGASCSSALRLLHYLGFSHGVPARVRLQDGRRPQVRLREHRARQRDPAQQRPV